MGERRAGVGLSHLVAAHGPWKRAKGKPRAGARLALKGMCGRVCECTHLEARGQMLVPGGLKYSRMEARV